MVNTGVNAAVANRLVTLSVNIVTPLVTFLNMTTVIFVGGRGVRRCNGVFTKLNILFVNVNVVDSTVIPLHRSRMFVSLVAGFGGPLLNVLTNTMFATVVRSSSTSINVLRTLTVTKLMSFETTMFILFNRGVNAYVATILTTVNAGEDTGQAAVVRLSFGLVNATIFAATYLLLPIASLITNLSPSGVSRRVTGVRAVFGVAAAVLLVPFKACLTGFTRGVLPSHGMRLANVDTLGRRFHHKDVDLNVDTIRASVLLRRVGGVVSGTSRGLGETCSTVLKKDAGGLRGVAGARRRVSVLGHRVSRCVSGVLMRGGDERGMTSVRRCFLVANGARHVNSRTTGVTKCIGAVRRGDVRFSRNTGRRVRGVRGVYTLTFGGTIGPRNSGSM